MKKSPKRSVGVVIPATRLLTDPLPGKLSKVSSDKDRVKLLKALEKACKRA